MAYLAHYGILGQKWGVRRFQNKDGSYTAAGKNRRNMYEKAIAPSVKKGKDKSPISPAEDIFKKANSALDDADKIAEIVGRKKRYEKINAQLSKMSDEEIRAVVARMNLEQSYRDAINKQASVNGKLTTADILATIGATVGIAASVAGIASTIYSIKKSSEGGEAIGSLAKKIKKPKKIGF